MTDVAEQPAVAGQGGRIGVTGRLEWLLRLAGPVFDKELRVSARRRRSYLLRVAYLAGLVAVLAFLWWSHVGPRGPTTARTVSMMAVVGRDVTQAVLTFQFLVLPLLAGLMTATSLVEEVRRRTLEPLLATPVTDLEIIVGKLAGRLLPLGLLVAISLPVLIVVRALGGVPWSVVVAATGITLTACLAMGSLGMMVSTYARKMYSAVLIVIVLPAAICLLFWSLIAFGVLVSVFCLFGNALPFMKIYQSTAIALGTCDPFFTFYQTVAMLIPGSTPYASSQYAWCMHMAIMMAFSSILIWWAARRVHRVAEPRRLRDHRLHLTRTWRSAGMWSRRGYEQVAIRWGREVSPVLWRETRTLLLPTRRMTVTLLALAVIIIFPMDLMVATSRHGSDDFAITMALVLAAIGYVATAVLTALGVAQEREAGTLAALLTTPLSERTIIWGKAAGAIRRSLVAWTPLGLHLLALTLLFQLHPLALLQILLLLAGIILAEAGTGAFFSVWLRTATGAALANLALAIGVVVVPYVVGYSLYEFAGARHTPELVALFSPGVPIDMILQGALGERPIEDWPVKWLAAEGPGPATAAAFLIAMAYYLFGWLLFSRLAGGLLRRG
jgi:ABC-type transport system involved in multi-copper enzyme maturation permease subunit